MLLSMLKVERTKLFRRKVLWVELAIVATLIIFLFGAMLLLQNSVEVPDAEKSAISGALTWPNGIKVALALSSNQMLGILLIIVLSSIVVAQEYSWQTYTLPVRAGIPRFIVLTSKFMTLLIAVLLLVFTALVVGIVMSGLLTFAIEGRVDLSQIGIADALFGALTTAYSLLPYVALTFLIAVLLFRFKTTRTPRWARIKETFHPFSHIKEQGNGQESIRRSDRQGHPSPNPTTA